MEEAEAEVGGFEVEVEREQLEDFEALVVLVLALCLSVDSEIDRQA